MAHTPSQELESLLASIAVHEKVPASSDKGGTIFFGVLAFVCVWLLLSEVMAHGITPFALWFFWPTLASVLVTLALILSSKKAYRRNTTIHNQAILLLTRYDDARAVPALLDEFNNSDKEVRGAVRGALLRLLPQLQTTDAHLLNSKQRDILCALPFTTEFHHEAFRLAALRAIGQIGDRRALRLMQKNGESLRLYPTKRAVWPGAYDENVKIMKPNPRYPLLKAAVEACVAAIETRLDAEQAGETLLRGSQAPADTGETLLRPATSAPTADPKHLLRPAAQEPDAPA